MLSAALDSSGSPKKRAFSRGASEDESLRSFIKEAENSSRRLTRSDSRAGTLKKKTSSQTEQELFMGLPEMLELRASYEEAVVELRGLEVERDTLLFQVDVLQDSLEGVEELLAEAQREAGQASAELERERAARRKLESMASALMKEVERLKEEISSSPGRGSVSDEPDAVVISEAHRAALPPGGGSGEVLPPGGGSEEVLVVERLRRLTLLGGSPVREPSLALDGGASEDGVLRRPYENGLEDERTDSDSVSAYEDAPSDTPDTERRFPGEGAADDLPLDPEQDPEGEKNESCVVS